jgi:carboxymethylenebutenolidase
MPTPAARFALVLLAVSAAWLPGCGGGSEDDYTARMAEEHREDSPRPTEAATTEPELPVETQQVAYATVDGKTVRGYVARTDMDDAPGLIVIHEWWGLNDNIRAMTRRLAGEGYVVLAVDLYGGEVAEDRDRAMALMREATEHPERAHDNLRQARAYLETQVPGKRVGTIGWCFGGAWSLNAALTMPDEIDATVIYYGRLETDPAKLDALSMPILGIFGEEDEGIPVATVREFEGALRSAGKDVEIHVYPGADHAFANPSGEAYDAEAAEDAWDKTLAFLERHLKNAG